MLRPHPPAREVGVADGDAMPGGGEAAVAPGISLLIVGALSLIGFITWGIFNLTQLEQIPAAQRNQPGFMLGYNFTFYHFPLDLIVMAGGFAMLQRKWYGLAMTGAVLSVIPCCSPCGLLGLPFGIWALVVLMNDDVKAAF